MGVTSTKESSTDEHAQSIKSQWLPEAFDSLRMTSAVEWVCEKEKKTTGALFSPVTEYDTVSAGIKS